VKNKDLLVLSLLREDGRVSLTHLSKRTHIPVSTLFEQLRRYQHGLIKKHTAIVDFARLGYHARARVLLKAKSGEKDRLQSTLVKNPFMNELCKVNNGFDFMVEFIYHQMHDVEMYLDTLRDSLVVKDQVFYVVDSLKEEAFLSKEDDILCEAISVACRDGL